MASILSRVPKIAPLNPIRPTPRKKIYARDPNRVPNYIRIKRDPPTPHKLKRKKQYNLPIDMLEKMTPTHKNPFTQNKAKQGLFHAEKNFGFTRSKSKVKTNRSWQPNIQTKNLFSQVLEEPFRIQVTARMLRTIDKYGGVDRYLLYTPNHKIGDTTQDPVTKQFVGNKALHTKSRILDKLRYADEETLKKIEDLNITAQRIRIQ